MCFGPNLIGIRSMPCRHRKGIAVRLDRSCPMLALDAPARNPVCCNDPVSPNDSASSTAADVEAIQQVKYRYLRAMDTKHWDEFAETMTEDIVGAYGSSLGKELHFDNRKDLVEYLSSAMGPGVVTEHRVTHPEITVDGDTASAIWYLQDRVIVAEFDFMLIGAAFYRDQYRRTPDGWRISATGYDRTYEVTMSVADLKFKVKPGRARADLKDLKD